MVTAFSSMCPWKLPVPQCLNGACILGKVGNLGCSTLCTWLLLVSLPGWQLVFLLSSCLFFCVNMMTAYLKCFDDN